MANTGARKTILRVLRIAIAVIAVAAIAGGAYSAFTLANGAPAVPDEEEPSTPVDEGDSEGAVINPPPDAEVYDEGMFHTTPPSDHVVTDDDTGITFIDNELIVYVVGGTNEKDFVDFIAGYGGTVVGRIDVVNSYQVRFSSEYTYEQLQELARELENSEMVKDALPNLASYTNEMSITSDPAWNDESEVWGYNAINLPQAWDDVQADSSIVVGVYDNQFFDHEDLDFAALSSQEFDDRKSVSSHGTHVSGTIAAIANEQGSVGVGTGCSLVGYTWFGSSVEDAPDLDSYAALLDEYTFNYGIAYLVGRKNARVVNISASKVGKGGESLTYCATRGNSSARNVLDAAIESNRVFLTALLESHDFVICKAAGNDNNDTYVSIDQPTSIQVNGETLEFNWGYVPYKYASDVYSNQSDLDSHTDDRGDIDSRFDVLGGITDDEVASHIVIVGAAGRTSGTNYYVCNFSNGGYRTDLIAPGEEIYSTVKENGASSYSKKDWSGTSMATPMVSGVAALLYSVDPTFTGDQVKEMIVDTVNGDYRYQDSKFYGSYGMLNAAAAVNEAQAQSASEGTDNEPHERDIVLVLDVSGSMEGEPLDEVKTASKKFAETVFGNDARVSIVTFDSEAQRQIGFTSSQENLDAAVDAMYAGSSTNMYDGLKRANLMLNASQANKRIIVLMSDGEPNVGLVGDELVAYADTIKDGGVIIYTLGFFSGVSEGQKSEPQQLLERIASDGCHYEVTDASDLQFFFGDIADQINGVKYNYIRIACPVDVTVTYNGETLTSVGNNKAMRTSFGTLTFEEAEGVEGAMDAADADPADNTVKVLRLRDGPKYDVKIEGTGNGSMDYVIGFVDDEGEYSDMRRFDNIAITPATKITTAAENTAVTRLDVDENGDGSIDVTYAARANGRGRIVDNGAMVSAGMTLGACAAILLACLVAIAWLAVPGRKLILGTR